MSPIPVDSATPRPSEAPLWAIMVIAGAEPYTEAAISDVLAQSVPTKLLLIGQGLDSAFRSHLEQVCEAHDEQVLGWWFDPSVSLSAAWNRGLRFAWECGADEAWVVNNDVRLHPYTGLLLRQAMEHAKALFVTAVAVKDDQFTAAEDLNMIEGNWMSRGGPDFSCFLTSRKGHQKYDFDENFYPAYAEDLDLHRRYMLGGDGDKIFSVNLPYLHFASGTLKSMTPEARAAKERQIGGSRAYYEAKWGGPVNQERYTLPFDPESAQDGVTTPELQHGAAQATV